jgi:hypothetical protein
MPPVSAELSDLQLQQIVDYIGYMKNYKSE